MTRSKLIFASLMFLCLFAVLLASVAGLPFVLVWTVNTLFSNNTPYNMGSWLAGLLALVILKICATSVIK